MIEMELFILVLVSGFMWFILSVITIIVLLTILKQNRKRFDTISSAADRIKELIDQTTSGNVAHKRGNILALADVIKRNLN